MPVGGGEEKQVVPEVSQWVNFAVTANGVYFFPDKQTLQLLDEKTGLDPHGGEEGGTLGVLWDDHVARFRASCVLGDTILHVDVMMVEASLEGSTGGRHGILVRNADNGT